MTILDAIDTTKDNKIELQELEKALDEGFFDNEENLLQIKKNLEENATGELVESLKTTLNSAIKEILIQEDFSDNDLRIIKLWNTLLGNNDEAKKETSEIVVFLNSLIPNLDISIDEIAKKTNFSDKDQRLCLVYRIILSYWGENQKIEELDLLIEKVQDTIMYNGLKEEIEKDANESLNNFAQNLVSLGVNIKQGFKWVNLTKDIKEPKDVNKITEDNIQNYLSLSPDIPKENYKYIVSNVQYLLAQHLAVYPKYVNHAKSWLGDAGGKMNIEHIQSSDEYMEKLFSYMAIFTKKPESEQIKEIAQRMLNPKSNLDGFNNFYVFNLWAQSLGDEKFQKILPKIFEKIPVNQCQAFFTFCKNENTLHGAEFLNGAYIDYILKKENGLKEYWGTHNLIDMKKLQEFSILKGGSPEFDSLFDNTQKIKEMYDALKPLHIDISIPLNDVQSFFNGKAVHESKISQLKIQRKQAFENEVNRQNTTHATLSMMGPGAARMTERGERTAATNPYDKKIQEEYIALEKDYVTLLLKSKTFKKDLFNGTIGIENGPKGRIQGLSSAGVILDFSKGNNPDSIVRDRFGEMTQDQWNQFLWNMDNDKQAAFGSFVGMVGGIAGAFAATVITGATNPFVTGAGFTVGLRLGNGLGQEVWNTGEWIYEKASGNTISNGNNKVEAFGQGFLRGVGWLDSDYNEVGISKFVSQLGFDYVASAATFGLSQKFGGFLGKLEGVKFAGGALKFGMEELIIENFLVDIPNNIIQTGFETLTGIDNKIMVGNTVVGQKTGLENERETKAGSFSDMLSVMWDACKQNFSFENMSQTFFNTVVYGGLLEGGGAAIRKIKSHLPSGQVADFEAKSAASVAALAGFTKFLTDSNITVDENTGALIDAKTGNVLTKNDPRIPKYEAQWKNVQATGINTITSLETLIETQKKIVADPNNPQGLLFRLGLISPTNSPLNIIDKKLDIIEKKIKEAEKKGDTKKIETLEALKKEYAKAQIMLNVGDISGEFNKQIYEQSKKDKQDLENNTGKIEFTNEKKYINSLENINQLRNGIEEQLKKDPKNNLLKRKLEEYELAILIIPIAFKGDEMGIIECSDPQKGIYKLTTKEGGVLFGSIYSIMDADKSLLQYQEIAKRIAFNEDTLLGIKTDEGIKFKSSMVNSGSFAQSNVHPFPADLDFGEHIKISINNITDSPHDVMSELLKNHIQSLMREIKANPDPNLIFTGAKIGSFINKEGKKQSFVRTANEILNGLHRESGTTLEEVCKDPGFFKFDYILIQDGIPKECTKVTSVTLEFNNKKIYSNLLEGVGAQEVYFKDPSEHGVIEALYDDAIRTKYTDGFLKNDVIKYKKQGNLLKACKRLYNYIKCTDTTPNGRQCIYELSSIFSDPVLSGAGLIDALNLSLNLEQSKLVNNGDISKVANTIKKYSENHLTWEEQAKINNNLEKIIDKNNTNKGPLIQGITNLIQKRINKTVEQHLEKSPKVKQYFNKILNESNK